MPLGKWLKTNWKALIFSVALCRLTAVAGTWAAGVGLGYWLPLIKQSQPNFPAWIYYIFVWGGLYLLMGISLTLLRSKKDLRSWGYKASYAFFMLMLSVGVLWPLVFYRLGNVGMAFTLLVILVGVTMATVITMHKVNRLATHLLLPYLAWLFYMLFLNYNILARTLPPLG